jgi:hypothetical protein
MSFIISGSNSIFKSNGLESVEETIVVLVVGLLLTEIVDVEEVFITG